MHVGTDFLKLPPVTGQYWSLFHCSMLGTGGTCEEAGPTPQAGAGLGVPKTCGIASMGSSWENRTWRAMYGEEYGTAAEEATGKVTKGDWRVDFVTTIRRDKTTHEDAPMASFYIPGTKQVTLNSSEFIAAKQWLPQQRSTEEVQAEAERREKGILRTSRKHMNSNHTRNMPGISYKERWQHRHPENRRKNFGAHQCRHKIGPLTGP